MKTIWKFPLAVADVLKVDMPKRAQILCVQMQKGTPCLWALVDPYNKVETRTIAIVGTGHPAPEYGNYIGTFQLYEGALVFHVFDYNPRLES